MNKHNNKAQHCIYICSCRSSLAHRSYPQLRDAKIGMKTLGHPVCPFNLNHRISSSYSCIEVSCFSLPRKSFEMTLSPNVWSGNSCQSNYVLYFSILNFDKTESCLVNAQGMFWRKKKKKNHASCSNEWMNCAFYLPYICSVKKTFWKLSCDCYHSTSSFQKSVEK